MYIQYLYIKLHLDNDLISFHLPCLIVLKHFFTFEQQVVIIKRNNSNEDC
jgi:hypothetical protein